MEVLEESAIITSTTPPKVWKRYVDDSFVIIKEHSVGKFHDTLNAVDPKISLTNETENNGQISFLETLITRKNGAVTICVYRKPTHTDRYGRPFVSIFAKSNSLSLNFNSLSLNFNSLSLNSIRCR